MKRFPKPIGHCLTTALITSALLEAAVLPVLASVEAQPTPEPDAAAETPDIPIAPPAAVAPPEASPIAAAPSPADNPAPAPPPIAGYAKPATAAHPKPTPSVDSGIAAAAADRRDRLTAARQEVTQTLEAIVERNHTAQPAPLQPDLSDAAIDHARAAVSQQAQQTDPHPNLTPEARAELLERIAAAQSSPTPADPAQAAAIAAAENSDRAAVLPAPPAAARGFQRRAASGQAGIASTAAFCRSVATPQPTVDRPATSQPQLGAEIALKLPAIAPPAAPLALRPALSAAEVKTISKPEGEFKLERSADGLPIVEVSAVPPGAIGAVTPPVVRAEPTAAQSEPGRVASPSEPSAWTASPIVTELTEKLAAAAASAPARTAQKAKTPDLVPIAAPTAAPAQVCAKALSAQMVLDTSSRSVIARQFSRAGIRFPLPIAAAVTSTFGWRIHPITGDRRFHEGVDFGAPMGTPVLAAHAGYVVTADRMGGYGLTVVLENRGATERNLYAHLSGMAVQPGTWVEQGAVIGWVGSTGNSTGPHLHFETQVRAADGWIAVNPLAVAGMIAQSE